MRWLPVLLFVGYVGYYYLTHQEEVPLTGRKQLVDLNREQEMALGYQSYRQILNQSQVIPSGQAVDLVREIGRRLAAVAEDPGFKWEFNVVASDQVNAFCLCREARSLCIQAFCLSRKTRMGSRQ